jgi:hypothetical protein
VVAVLWFRPRYDRVLLCALVVTQCVTLFPRGNGKRRPLYQATLQYLQSTSSKQRLLVADTANSNILFDRESLAVTDSVLNRHFRDFFLRFFVAENAGTMLQPRHVGPLTDTQALALRSAGVEGMFGYRQATQFIDDFHVAHPLPRAFLVSSSTFADLKAVKIGPDNVADVLRAVEADLATLPQPRDVRVVDETVRVSLPARASESVLVVNQAYSPGWKLDGREPMLAADLWPAWRISAGPETTGSVVYWPQGLTIGIVVSTAGVVAASLFYVLVVRKERTA